jgi:outer membrane protein
VYPLVRIAVLLVAAALLAVPQPAPNPLTLDDCVRLAQSVESAVSLARQETEIAGQGVVQARAGFLPQSYVANVFTYNSPRLDNRNEFSFVALNGIREYGSLFSTAAELDTSGRLRAGLARAHADQDVAASNLGITQRDLRRTVTSAYLQVLLSRHLASVARDILTEAQSFEKRTRLLFQNGEAAQADVVKAAAQSAFFEQTLRNAELEAQLANHDLASFWTTSVSDPLPLVDVLDQPVPPPPPEAPSVAEAYMRRIEFNLLDAQRRGFEADYRRFRAELLPQASLVFQYGIDANHVRIADRGYAAFVNLDIPVFQWFRTRSAARQSQLRAQQVQSTRRITERAFSRDYQNALSRVKMIYQQISITEAQVKLSGDNLRLSRLRYEGGEGSALDVVTAQTQLVQARANYYTALSNYLNARADLEVASGK